MKELTLKRGKKIKVPSLKAASEKFREWIDENCYGSRDLDTASGRVSEGGKLVARVSYNGRVWTPEIWPKCKEITV